jgi:hypothetical protein
MAKPRSLLQALLGSARRALALQVLLSVFAIALAGWTLSVTASLLREQAKANDRIVQLEETLASNNIVPPPPRARVEAQPGYPPSVAAGAESRGAGPSVADLFAPPPPLRRLVVHVREQEDLASATAIAKVVTEAAGMPSASVALMARDPRPPGYYYFDGRQSAEAAELAARFNDAARDTGLAPWSARLRATALPSSGEYAANRVDIVLPALPPAPEPTQPEPGTEQQSP